MIISRPNQPSDEITDFVMTGSPLTDEIKGVLEAASRGNAQAEAIRLGYSGAMVVNSQIIQRPDPAFRSVANPDALITEITTIYRVS